MIKNVSIENFKGIQKCMLENLGSVNILVGKNDSCKSTIMEAIHVTLKEFIAASLNLVLSRRSNVSFGARELWYHYKTSKPIQTQINFGNRVLKMVALYDEANNIITSSVSVGTLKDRKIAGIREGPVSTYMGPGFSIRTSGSHLDYLTALTDSEKVLFTSYIQNTTIVDSSSRNNLQYIESLLRDIKLEGLESEFGGFLYETFKTAKKWEFMPHPDLGQTRLAQRIGNRYLFLTGVGDGIRFSMIILAESMLRHNTALFIEEIENNQHPASLAKVIRILVDIAKKNNLQIFVTTHSHFAWRNFEEVFGKSNKGETKLQIFHVVRKPTDGIVTCKPLTEKEYAEWMTGVDKDLLECKY